jgi:hypothetical protein
MRVLIPALILLAGTAGLTTASAFVGSGHEHGPDAEWPRDLLPLPGTASLESTARDVAGGRDWGARVSDGAGGRTCLAVAPVVGGTLELLAGWGKRPEGPESCGDLSRSSPDYMMLQANAFDGRLVVSGVVGSEVAALTIATPAGPRQLSLSARGAYLAVFAGSMDDLPEYPITAELESGRTLVYDWVSAPPRKP